jgi:hypothetical protein
MSASKYAAATVSEESKDDGGAKLSTGSVKSPLQATESTPSAPATVPTHAAPKTAAAIAAANMAAAGRGVQRRLSALAAANGEDEEEPTPIVDVFFLSWPELYIQVVQSLIMILALYFSLYFTNFIAASGSVGWRFITLTPAVLSSLLLMYIIKCAVMLSAIHAVDCDAILEVLEQTEGAQALSALMREKVMSLLNEMGPDPEVELYNLFSEVDSDHSGAIR